MKRIISVLLILVMVVCFCSCNDEVDTATSSAETSSFSFDINSVDISSLPTELLSEDLSNWNTINLIAELPDENVMLYGLAVTDDAKGVIFRKDDNIYYYDWIWFTNSTKMKLPEMIALDVDDDDNDEIAVSVYVDYNTDVSTEELHVIDLDAANPVHYCYTESLLKTDFYDKFNLRYKTDEVEEEEETSSKAADKDKEKDETESKDEVVSKSWLIDHSSDIGKHIVFEEKEPELEDGEELDEDWEPKVYFSYDATRDVREYGAYKSLIDPHTNLDYTLTEDGITAEIRVAAKFEKKSSVTFICLIKVPISMEGGKFVMGDMKYKAIR